MLEGPASRTPDPRIPFYTLAAEAVWVECPRCGRAASHVPLDVGRFLLGDVTTVRRLVCAHCGLSREPFAEGFVQDRLWLRASVKGETLWAYHSRHLDLLEAYVAAMHRAHAHDPALGWSNRSFLNRLPTWMTASRNREVVLAAIARIRRDRPIPP